MKTNPRPVEANKITAPSEPQIICTDCRTSKHLTVESIHAVVPRTDGWVAVEYSCGQCESFYAHNVPVQAVARFLATTDAQTTTDAQPGVVKFGRDYIHCGEPMDEAGRKIAGITMDDDDFNGLPTVYIPAAVLKCQCGFQMSIPS